MLHLRSSMAIDPLDYERDKMIGSRHPHRGRWGLLLAIVAIAALAVWLVPQNRNDRESWNGSGMATGATSRQASGGHADRPVGTSGVSAAAGEEEGSQVVREIETITGANDAMTLVGRRVDLHVDVLSRANDHAFWVGSPDNRVLVVLGRDNRNGEKRQAGTPASHGIAPVTGGQTATISGVVQAIPKAEDRFNWNLTRQDEDDLHARKVYIRADSVSSEGHGTN
jgi:hypothetical protein